MFYSKPLRNASKENMAQFLAGHYRYETSNSRHSSKSYANACKVNRLGLAGTQLDKAYEVLALPETYEHLQSIITMFTHQHDGLHTIGFGGRNSGYLVLFESEYRETGHKSYCPSCGQRNFQHVQEGATAPCGVCEKPRVNFIELPRTLQVKSSGIDAEFNYNDFLALSKGELNAKVDLVMGFDQACDRIRDEFIAILNDYMVIEETVMIPSKVRRLERI